MKPHIHSLNSVKRFGGVPEDYIDIHNLIDSSKSHFADIRHRAIFHNTMGPYVAERLFGIPNRRVEEAAKRFSWSAEEKETVLELIKFSKTSSCTGFKNSDNTTVQVRDVAEAHIIEDLGKIPTLGEYLSLLPMDNRFHRPAAPSTIGKGISNECRKSI